MNGIELVLRYSAEPMDPQNRQSILQGVNRPLVYHRDLDITGEVLDRLNRARVSDQRGAAGAGAPPAAHRAGATALTTCRGCSV